jgi:hypothetical protein
MKVIIAFLIAVTCVSCQKKQESGQLSKHGNSGSDRIDGTKVAPKRAYPFAISVFRDGGSREIEYFNSTGELIGVVYFAKSNNPKIDGKLFRSSDFIASNEISVNDAESIFNEWNKLLTRYYGMDKLDEILKKGRKIERDFYEKIEKGEPIANEKEIRNNIETYYLMSEVEAYRERWPD